MLNKMGIFKGVALAFVVVLSVFIAGVQEVAAKDDNKTLVQESIDGMPVYPGTETVSSPGDVLYTDKTTTDYYTGHIAVVTNDGYVVHAPGKGSPGLERMTVNDFINTYEDVQVWTPDNSTDGQSAGEKANNLFNNYSGADYTVWTTLTGDYMNQYCTKVVWQSYYYGADVNLGSLSLTKASVPPHAILDTYHLTKIEGGL